jgi:hypothetical protein
VNDSVKMINRMPNTKAEANAHMVSVRLHGNEIVFIDLDESHVILSTKGHKTHTTFMRINAALAQFNTGLVLRSHRGDWYVRNTVQHCEVPFRDGMLITLIPPL